MRVAVTWSGDVYQQLSPRLLLLHPAPRTLPHTNPPLKTPSFYLLPIIMSGGATLDWDSKTVIGSKARAPKVTRNTAELNGVSYANIS
jgi:hypothetical protein